MTVRIGTNPIAWSNDDLPELGGETPLEVCLSEARAAGYAGIELGNKFPRHPDVLAPILKNHDLALVSGWYSANLLHRSAEDEIAAMQPHLKLLQALGCAVMVFAETAGAVHGDRAVPLSRRPILENAQWQPFTERLTEVANYLQGQNMAMAYHHHMGTVIETADEVDRLMADTVPSVGLLIDTGHLTFAGADPADVYRRHAARVRHIHCKDVRPEILTNATARDASFLDAVIEGVFTVPGDGAVKFDAVLAVAAEFGYEGWLVVEAEQDPAKSNPLQYASLGYRNLAGLVEAAGV